MYYDNLTKLDILKLLPLRLRKDCLVGIADPRHYDNLKSIFIDCKKKWTGKPSDFFPETRSVIVLIHFSPIAKDYHVEKYCLSLARNIFNKYGVKSHLLNKYDEVDESKLLGVEWGPGVKTYDKIFLLKDAAYFAGLGQFGKNSLLINSEFGSDFKIQAILVNRKMTFDRILKPAYYPGCAKCKICNEICPTGAIDSSYRLNYKRCYILYRQKKMPSFCVIGKTPRKINYYNIKDVHTGLRLASFKNLCRACQAFCKVNKHHYKSSINIISNAKICKEKLSHI